METEQNKNTTINIVFKPEAFKTIKDISESKGLLPTTFARSIILTKIKEIQREESNA